MDELDQLAGLAAAADQSAAVGQPGLAVPVSEDPAQHVPGADEQATDIINGFAGVLAGYAPDTASIWTEQARQASAAAISPLIVKYNINLGAIPPELTAAIVVGPLLYRSATIVGDKIKTDRAAKLAPTQRAAIAPPGAPGAGGMMDSTGQALAAAPAAPGEAPAPAIHPQMALYA